jgi:hypothetical protein
MTRRSSEGLVHPCVRSVFREACSDYSVVRQIERAFDDEGFTASTDSERNWYESGQRRGTFDRHTADVDWSNPGQVRRVLNVFESILQWTEGEYRDNLVRHLQRAGFSVDEVGRISDGTAGALLDLTVDQLKDPASIIEHLDRIAASSDDDPALAISGAKALIEATTKLVLLEVGEEVDDRADIPALVKAAQRALALHPDTLAPSKPGVEITKRILSNLSQLAIGVAELRNQYGPDHGRTSAVVGLRPRHAHLARSVPRALTAVFLWRRSLRDVMK